MKYLTIKCDGITSISSQYYSGEIEIELENVDLASLLLKLDVEEIVRNSDMYAVLDYLDTDMLKEYIAERFGVNIE